MSIGVEFTLKASTAAFTRGLATISNETEKLRKGIMGKFEGRDLARGLVTAFGLSIEKIADKFARLWTGMSEEAEAAYKELGSLTDTLTEKTLEAGRAKLTEEQKYQLALIETARLQRAIAENAGKTTEDQIKLTKDKIALIDKERQASEAKEKADKEKADKAEKDAKMHEDLSERGDAAAARMRKEADDETEEYRKAERQQEAADKALSDKFAPTVEQLAGMSTGGFTAADDPRLIARQIIEKEKQASMLGGRGDISGALSLGREARTMRESLQFQTGGGQALTQQTAEAAFKTGLEPTNAKIDDLIKAVGGVIKATE